MAQGVVSAMGILFIRSAGSQFQNTGVLNSSTVFMGGVGIFLYALSFATWVLILSMENATYAFPISIGVSLVVTTIGASYFLEENLNLIQLAGILLLVISVFMVTVSAKS